MSDQNNRRTVTSSTDLTYVRAELRPIDVPSPSLPAPSYYDVDGIAYVPRNYAEQEASRERFTARAFTESERLNAGYDADWIAETWEAYWDGIYGMCLKDNSPENIVRKNWLIDRIEALLEATLRDEAWIAELASRVNDLDALERPFCDFDRVYFGGSVSRDRCITAVRQRFPEIASFTGTDLAVASPRRHD